MNEYHLNTDQYDCLYKSAIWCYDLLSNKNSDISIHLVHGIFGSGKTYFITILLIFLDALLDYYNNDKIKILICCNTNIAVDRILLGLLSNNFDKISRVGCLKRINPLLLPYVCHNTDKLEDDIKQLQELLHLYPSDSEEYQNILKTINTSRNSVEKQNKILKVNRIMGTTFVASQFPILNNNEYRIVITDEASQITEPMVLIIIIRIFYHL